MENFIEISKNGEFIDVDFGDYGDGKKQSFEKRYRVGQFVEVERFDDHILLTKASRMTLQLVHELTPPYHVNYVVKKIDGNDVTSLLDLYNKLKAIM